MVTFMLWSFPLSSDSTAPVLEIAVPTGERPTRVYWTQFSEELLVTFESGLIRKYDPKVRNIAHRVPH
jgi:hypothetical protein